MGNLWNMFLVKLMAVETAILTNCGGKAEGEHGEGVI